jgi:homoserine O-succinyltransferase
VHLAATPDRRSVFMQGHPEYEPVSLLKEHKREVGAFAEGRRPDYPEVPVGIVAAPGQAMLAGHRQRVLAARRGGGPPPAYPEAEVLPHLADRWRADTVRFFAAWLAPVAGPSV